MNTEPTSLFLHLLFLELKGKWHTWNSGKIQKWYHNFNEYYGRHWYPGNPTPSTLHFLVICLSRNSMEPIKTSTLIFPFSLYYCTINYKTTMSSTQTTIQTHKHALALALAHTVHSTTRNQKDAVEFLKRRPNEFADKPFFLLTAFFAPHAWDGNAEQFLPQNETFEVYADLTLKAPYDMAASFQRLPQNVFNERNEGRNRWRHRFDTPEKYDRMLKNYFRLITGVDTACKAVWDELDRQGILDETMFIFTTDNGFVSTDNSCC